MTKFAEWCVESEIPVASHKLRVLAAKPTKQSHAVKLIAKAVPDYYAAPDRIAGLLTRLGRPEAAKYVKEKLPTSLAIRSGDLGEILCTAYVREATSFNIGIKRLRWKDHRNMSMRGDDVLAFSIGPKGKTLRVLKAEIKSRATLRSSVVKEARKALAEHGELPSAHAIGFVADRLGETGDKPLRDALDDVQLKHGFKTSQVTHMLFTFSGNDPSNMLSVNLSTYAGVVPQHYVGLQVSNHQAFIKSVFDAVRI